MNKDEMSTKKPDVSYSDTDIDNIVNILDGFGNSEIGRLKL